MIKIKFCEKEYFRYFGGNYKGFSINFIDENENFIGTDLDYAEEDYCLFLVDVETAKGYKNIGYEDIDMEEKIREEILEKKSITINNYLEFEEKLKDVKILNGNINQVSEGVCYFELTNNMAILFIGNEDEEYYTAGETYKQMYSCYNKALTIFNKIESKKNI